MKAILTLAIALCASATTLRADEPIPPLGFENPIYMGTFDANALIQSKASSANGRTYFVVVAWRVDNNKTEYSIDVKSIENEGPTDVFEEYTTQELFDHIAVAAVIAGIDSAYSTCASGASSTGVTLASCVTPNGFIYTPASEHLVRRTYSYTCSTMWQTGVLGGVTCSGGSETTSGCEPLQ